MLFDGIKLIGKNVLPVSAERGEIVYLISQDGANAPGFYKHDGNAWANVGSGGADASGSGIDGYTHVMWHCDDTTDSSKYGTNNMTLQNGAQIGSSGHFDGNAIYFQTADGHVNIPLDAVDFGAEDWTIDFRCRIDSDTAWTSVLWVTNPETIMIMFNGGVWGFQIGAANDYNMPGSAGTETKIGQYQHIALVRNGGEIMMFIDGVKNPDTYAIGGGSLSTPLEAYVGIPGSGWTGGFQGAIDEFRISKGVARWTENFTPPTERYSLDTSLNLAFIEQDIVPDVDNVHSLGAPDKMWRDVYIGPGSLYVNGQKVIEDNSGTITLSADTDQNIQIRSQGGGDIEFYPSGTGNIDMKGNLSIQAGKNLTSGDGQPISCPVGFDNLTVNNLTVNGTTTTVNTENVNIADNILTLNSNAVGTPSENAGITINRGDENNASILWNESVDKWQFTADGVNFTDLGSGEGGGGIENVDASSLVSYTRAFSAFKTGDQSILANTYTVVTNYTETANNMGSDFDPVTGIFSPSVAGFYYINAIVSIAPNSGAFDSVARISKNGSAVQLVKHKDDGINWYYIPVSALVYLNGAGDTIDVSAYVGGAAGTVKGEFDYRTSFEAFMVGSGISSNGNQSPVACIYELGADQAFAQSATADVVGFDTSVHDTTDNYFDTATSQFKPKVAGFYQISATVRAVASNTTTTTGIYGLIIDKLGNAIIESTDRIDASLTTTATTLSALVYFNGVDDYITINAKDQGSNTSFKAIGSRFSAYLINTKPSIKDIAAQAMPYAKVGEETLLPKRHPVNGKPVYTTTMYIASVIGGDNYVDSVATDGENATVVDFGVHGSDGWMYQTDFYAAANNTIQVFTKNDGSQAKLTAGSIISPMIGQPGYITIEYTKVAEGVNSPVAPVVAIMDSENVSAGTPYPELDKEVLLPKRHPVSGKPVYTKAFKIAVGTTDLNYDTNLIGVEQCRVVDYTIDLVNGFTLSPAYSYVEGETSESVVGCMTDGSQIYIGIADGNANYTNIDYLVVLEYTKTADTNASSIGKVEADLLYTDGTVPYTKSGEETLTHKRHPVSGKPIYVQTYTGSTGSGGTITKATGLTGVDSCSLVDWSLIGSNNTTYSPGSSWYEGAADKLYAQCDSDGTNVYFNISTTFAGYHNGTYEATIEYTKTNDTAESPVATLKVGLETLETSVPYSKLDTEVLTTRRHPVSGKPIYSYVKKFTPVTSDNFITGFSGLDFCITKDFWVTKSNDYVSTISSADENNETVLVKEDGTSVWINVGTGSTGRDFYIEFEYTKTVDTDESPIAVVTLPTANVSDGIPYSKIGTETLTHRRHPVSGKPVYAQTYHIPSIGTTHDGNINTGLSGVENAHLVDFVMTRPDGVVLSATNSYSSTDASQVRARTQIDGTIIYYWTSDSAADTNSEFIFYLEYTKVADTSNSPVAFVKLPGVDVKTEIPYTKVGEEVLTTKRHPVSGKPVYTQSYYIADVGTTYDSTIAHGLTNLEDYGVTEFVLKQPSGRTYTQAGTYYIGETNEALMLMHETTIDYHLSDHVDTSNSSLLITVEYTKADDTTATPTASVVASVLDVETTLPYAKVGEETLLAKRHPDSGKPLYTQSYSYTATADTLSTPTGLTGVDLCMVVNTEVHTDDGLTVRTGSASGMESNGSWRIWSAIDGSTIESRTSGWYTGNKLVVTLEYTKTSDDASSPIAKPILQTLEVEASIPYPKVGEEVLTTKRHPINNKPIYTRAIYSADGGVGDINIPTGLTGIDMCYLTHFEVYISDGEVRTGTGNYYSTADSELRCWTTSNGANITLRKPNISSWNNQPYTITMEYTKGADTSNSPVAGIKTIKQPGEIIQVAEVEFNPASHTTINNGYNFIDMDFTPKSTNSKLIIEAVFTTYFSSNSVQESFVAKLFIDDVEYMDNISSRLGRYYAASILLFSCTGKLIIPNNSITQKNYSIRASDVNNTPEHRANEGMTRLIITEVQQ